MSNVEPFLESLSDIYPPVANEEGPGREWKYESRREAQQILPHLWLGPYSAAKDAAFVKENNITLLLAIRSSMTARAKFLCSPYPDVRYETIDVPSTKQLISQFQKSHDAIDQNLLSGLPVEVRQAISLPLDGRSLSSVYRDWRALYPKGPLPGGKTLVFCETGNDRSAVVVASYVMQYYDLNAPQSIQMVQEHRFCVCFDDATKWMLKSYEPMWPAQKQGVSLWQKQNCDSNDQSSGESCDIFNAPRENPSHTRTSKNLKRRIDVSDDENGALDGNENPGRAPFSDLSQPLFVEMDMSDT